MGRRPRAVHVALAAALAGLLAPAADAQHVRAQGDRFALDGIEFKFVGFNVRGLAHYGYGDALPLTTVAHRTEVLDAARQTGSRVVRIFLPWATISEDETIARLRVVLDNAVRYDQRAIVALTDQYDTRFNPWFCYADPSPNPTYFYVNKWGTKGLNPTFYGGLYRQAYLPYVRRICSTFRDHAGVFAWELTNEGGCLPPPVANKDAFIAFCTDMAGQIRAVDPNHMVTAGIIGTPVIELKNENGNDEPARLYQNLDFVTVHDYDPIVGGEWQLAQRLGKPFIVEEAGRAGGRDGWFRDNMNYWFGNGADGYLGWGFMPTSIDNQDGDRTFGIDRVLHGDYDTVTQVWKDRAAAFGTPAPAPPPSSTPAPLPPGTPAPVPPPPPAPIGGASILADGSVHWEAENYVAFSDTTSANLGGRYRNDGVDIENCSDTGGGYDVGWIEAGEWLDFSGSFPKDGQWQIAIRHAALSAHANVHVEVDGRNVTGTVVLPPTGGWQTWDTLVTAAIPVSAGPRRVRLYMETAWFNVNWIRFIPVTAGGTTPPPPPPGTTAPPPPTGSGLPDVVVDAIAVSPANPAAGQAVTFSSVVRNTGSGPVASGVVIGVLYSINGRGTTWGVVNGPLAPGATVVVGTQGGTWGASTGTHAIEAFVDDPNRFAESDETNNKRTITITVGGSPTPAPPPPVTPAPVPVTPAPVPPGGPVIPNAGFESGVAPWAMWVGAGSNGDTIERDFGGAADGSWLLGAKGVGTGGKGAFQYVPSGWTAGRAYRLGMSVRNAGFAYAIGYRLGNAGAAGGEGATYGAPVAGGASWQRATVDFTVSGTEGVTIYLRAVNAGRSERAAFDAVTIESGASPSAPPLPGTPAPAPSGPPAPLPPGSPAPLPGAALAIPNPGFESGIPPWSLWAGAGSNFDGLERDFGGAAEGSWLLGVKGVGTGGPSTGLGASKGAFQYVPAGFVSGRPYRLSVAVKNVSGGGLRYAIGYRLGQGGADGAAGVIYGPEVAGTAVWQRASVDFTYSGAAGATIYLRAVNAGGSERAGFDAVAVEALAVSSSSSTQQPALVVTSVSAGGAAKARAKAAEDVTLSADVLNTGLGAVPAGAVIRVTFTADGVAVAEGTASGPLAPGQSVTVSAPVNAAGGLAAVDAQASLDGATASASVSAAGGSGGGRAGGGGCFAGVGAAAAGLPAAALAAVTILLGARRR